MIWCYIHKLSINSKGQSYPLTRPRLVLARLLPVLGRRARHGGRLLARLPIVGRIHVHLLGKCAISFRLAVLLNFGTLMDDLFRNMVTQGPAQDSTKDDKK
jgi:hypothetical protein